MLTDNPTAPLILLVEDDNNHALLIQRSFEDAREEYRLERVGTLLSAKAVTELHPPALVLTDYRLPDGYGSELVTLAAGARPVIIMTSQGNELVAVEAMKIGAQDYIVKSAEVFEAMPRTVALALKVWTLLQLRRQSDKAVIRAKTDWERTFDAVPDLISIIDLNHTIVRVNKAMAERCGLKAEEIVGRKCHEAVHGLSAPPCCCPSLGMFLDGQIHNSEIEEKSLNGLFDVTVSPLLDEEGRLTSYVHVMRDITERKQAKKALKESEEKHTKLANELKIILDTSAVGVIFVKNRKVLWANPAHCKMFGYDIRETENIDTAVYYVDKESYDYVGVKAYATIESGSIFSEDLLMKKKDGSLIWCNLVGQAINHDNMEEGSIWSILNITERKHAEEERQKLEHQFHQAQKLESLGILAGGIAHDFNNILTIILGHCYMAREDFIPEQDFKSTFSQIETAANRAADLCRQMLTYAGKSPLVQTKVNLWVLLDDVVKMLQATIKKNVTITLELNQDLPEILGDPGQLQQIIMNLIINAAEAIGEANGTIRILLANTVFEAGQTVTDTFGTLIKAGLYVCLEVADNGSGMDEETQKRIFEPFFTTKFTGRGLGMSAIHGIVKSHEGILQMTSTPAVGTTFKVSFPVANSSDYSGSTTSQEALSPKKGGSILLVEDEQALLKMEKTMLEAMDFTTLTAQDGQEALEIFRECGSKVDVILLDLIMPVMGGIDAYHELRKINMTVPIIICSGYGVESVEHIINNDPHAGFIHKPYKPGELLDLLLKMMEGASD
jgi:PAS domain S-box-containing protein